MKFKTAYLFLLGSMVLLIMGIYSGEASSTLKKAISICLSCIGIG